MRFGVALLAPEIEPPFVEAGFKFDRLRAARGSFDSRLTAWHEVEVDRTELAEIGRDGDFGYLRPLPDEIGRPASLARDEKEHAIMLAPRIAVEGERVDGVAVARLQPETAGGNAAAPAARTLIDITAEMSNPSGTVWCLLATAGPYPGRSGAGPAKRI